MDAQELRKIEGRKAGNLTGSGNLLDYFQDGQKRGAQKALEIGKETVKQAKQVSHDQ